MEGMLKNLGEQFSQLFSLRNSGNKQKDLDTKQEIIINVPLPEFLQTTERFPSPLNFDCWIEITQWLIHDTYSLLQLCLTHKATGALLYNEDFYKRLCAPYTKSEEETWKECFLTVAGICIPFNPDIIEMNFQNPKVEGIVHWIATYKNPLNKYINPVVSREIGIIVAPNWYSITKNSADSLYSLWAGCDPIQFPKKYSEYHTLCSPSNEGKRTGIVYDLGVGRQVRATHLVWYCDYDPHGWMQLEHLKVLYLDSRTSEWVLAPVEKIHPTSSKCTFVFEFQKFQKFRFFALFNTNRQTLVTGVELFGWVFRKSSHAPLNWSPDVKFLQTSEEVSHNEVFIGTGCPAQMYTDYSEKFYDKLLEPKDTKVQTK